MSKLRDLLKNPIFIHETPNRWEPLIDFSMDITAMAMSFHGFMFAFGFANGSIIISDSEVGSNKISFKIHKKKVTALDFTRDGHHIISGDESGNIVITNILDSSIIFENNCSSNEISEIKSCPTNINIFAARDSEKHLFLCSISNKKIKIIDSNSVGIVWKPNEPEILSGFQKKFEFINF